MKRSKGMAETPRGAQRLKIALFCAVLTLFAWVSCLNAANLRDIRIGEYSAHTRVVFEFDAPVPLTDRIVHTSGRITLMFQESEPALVRKIPFERSQRIENIQLWHEGTVLSAVILFHFDLFRYETFSMRNPFRIALDIYPLTGHESNGFPTTGTPSLPSQIEKKTETPDPYEARLEAPVSLPQTAVPVSDPLQPSMHTPTASLESQPGEEIAKLGPQSGVSPPEQSQEHMTSKVPQDLAVSSAVDSPMAKSITSPMQYYLMLLLVVLTLMIIGLLVIMLFSRHKWAEENKPLRFKELLKKQDDHIASINARIEEQLKRYDEA